MEVGTYADQYRVRAKSLLVEPPLVCPCILQHSFCIGMVPGIHKGNVWAIDYLCTSDSNFEYLGYHRNLFKTVVILK